jgi:hypothetical protein
MPEPDIAEKLDVAGVTEKLTVLVCAAYGVASPANVAFSPLPPLYDPTFNDTLTVELASPLASVTPEPKEVPPLILKLIVLPGIGFPFPTHVPHPPLPPCCVSVLDTVIIDPYTAVVGVGVDRDVFASVNVVSAWLPELPPSAVNNKVAPNSSSSKGINQVEFIFPPASAMVVNGWCAELASLSPLSNW